MRKIKLLLMCSLLIVVVCLCGCGDKGNVKVYENTEETTVSHEEVLMTAVITKMDMENNLMDFVSCGGGGEYQLIYHGGVSVMNAHDQDIGIKGVAPGTVVDVTYYADTNKLVSMKLSTRVTVLTGVKKFAVNLEKNTATYGAASCELDSNLVAFDGDTAIQPVDVSTEDEVTISLMGDKLVSVVITKGHGYVRLLNQGTYIGGFVEIGKDVIVPVTEDMLVAVGEGSYTLRLMKNGYSGEKPVTVSRGREVNVDVSDLAIPSGTVAFDISPEEVSPTITIDGQDIQGTVFTGLYGEHSLKITAEGYAPFRGSFKITEASKSLKVTMASLGDEEDTTEETTEDTTSGTASTDAIGSTTQTGNTENTTSATATQTGNTENTTSATTTQEETKNTITIQEPAGVGVYLDGDYVGIAPVTLQKTVGSHTVTLYKAGFLIKSYTIQLEDNGQDDTFRYPELVPLISAIE